MSDCKRFNFSNSKMQCTGINIDYTWSKSIQIKDKDGVPQDLTGYTIHFLIKKSKDGDVLFDLSEQANPFSTGIYIADPTTGLIQLKITDEDTATIAEGHYPYEFYKMSGSGEKYIDMYGYIHASDGVIV